MTTAIITRIYEVDLDSPTWPSDMPDNERLTAWLEMARTDPDEAFKHLVQSDVDGIISEES